MTTERHCPNCPSLMHLFQSNGISVAEAQQLRSQNAELRDKVEAQGRLINKLRGRAQGSAQRAS